MARTLNLDQKFLARLRVTDHWFEGSRCLEWTGNLNKGHGRFYLGKINGKVKLVQAHRWWYERNYGPLPPELHVDHLCRNRACCQLAHLEPVLLAENTLRSINVQKTHCRNGHPFDAVNTRIYRGSRECRACDNERKRKKRQQEAAPIKAFCKQGHPLTRSNVRTDSKGYKICRACERLRFARYAVKRDGEFEALGAANKRRKTRAALMLEASSSAS